MKITVTPRLLEKYPDAKFIAILADTLSHTKSHPKLEKERAAVQSHIKKHVKDAQDVQRIAEHSAFHATFGKSYPIEFQLKSIIQGKSIPKLSTLKDILFIAEMKHYCIISGHDTETLSENLQFDLSDGGESYVKLNGKSQNLKPDDIVLKQDGLPITTLLYGPGDSTKITNKTTSVLYLFWFASYIPPKELATIITDFKKLLKIVATRKSKITEITISKGEQTFSVTPWKVRGLVNYNKLIQEFGTKPLTEDLIKKIEKKAGPHHMLKRKIFFSHRELDVLLKEYEQGKEFALYTGRGPSGQTHLGHMVPWIFCKYLQDAFNVEFYFQITDDEKFMYQKDLTLEDTNSLARDNALDFLALGFKPKKTKVVIDTEYGKTMYKLAIHVAKKVTASQAKAVFGFNDATNIGMYFWPSMQAVPCLLPSYLHKKKIRTLIPAAIDQDPYWRIVRDVAPKLGYPKTAAIHNIFLPSLLGPEGKMSTSESKHATIFTTDTAEDVEKKIKKYAFSGGRDTIKEHREKGGNPDIDMSYQWLRFFEGDEKKLKNIYHDYKSGAMLTGELKEILIKKLTTFLKHHQKNRTKAKRQLDKFLLTD